MAEDRCIQILHVEDNAPEAKLVARLLESAADFRVTWRDTLRDALALLRDRNFDVVLLDLNLPDSHGLATFRTVRRAAPDAAVVVTTVVDDEDVAITAVGEGAQDYLVKGLTDARLLTQSLRYSVERQRLFSTVRASKADAERRSLELASQYEDLQAAIDRLSRALDRERAGARLRDERDRLKGELLSIFAHDLRSPIGVIHGFVEVMLQRWSAMSDRKKLEYLRTIKNNAANVDHLIADVLETARLEEGALSFDSRPFDLRAVLRTVVEQCNAATGEERVTLDAPEGSIAPALGDEHRQWQVASNLVGNALKFSPAGSPVVVTLERRGALLEVAVRDRGGGITEAEAARLFQRFSRLPRHMSSGAEPVGGTGLGLFIARSIVEAQGGSIHVESAPGKETAFVYTVPVAEPNRARSDERQAGSPHAR